MKLRGGLLTVVIAVAAALSLAACGGSSGQGSTGSGSSSSGTKSTPTPAATTPASTGATVKTATATVAGKSETILVNGQGLTLYYYTPDKDKSVTCTGGCAQAWPPLMASGTMSPVAGAPGTFGTTPNPAGGMVVTYNGWPLYTYAEDTAPGQTSGQGVGGAWFVATPTLAASTTASTGY